jgi:hypothetical protein
MDLEQLLLLLLLLLLYRRITAANGSCKIRHYSNLNRLLDESKEPEI